MEVFGPNGGRVYGNGLDGFTGPKNLHDHTPVILCLQRKLLDTRITASVSQAAISKPPTNSPITLN